MATGNAGGTCVQLSGLGFRHYPSTTRITTVTETSARATTIVNLFFVILYQYILQ